MTDFDKPSTEGQENNETQAEETKQAEESFEPTEEEAKLLPVAQEQDQTKKDRAGHQYNFNEENQNYLKTFVKNNLALVAGLYLVVFILTLIDNWLGILGFIGAGVIVYIQAVQQKGKETTLNTQIKDASKTGAATISQTAQSMKTQVEDHMEERRRKSEQGPGAEGEGSDSPPAGHDPTAEENLSRSAKTSAPASQTSNTWRILGMVFAGLTILAFYVLNYLNIPYYGADLSLNDVLTEVIDLLGRLGALSSGFESYFSEYPAGDTATIYFIRFLLNVFRLSMVLLPLGYILSLVFRKYILAGVLAILQLLIYLIGAIFLFSAIQYVAGEYTSSTVQLIGQSMDIGAYIFFIGMIAMIVAAFVARKKENTVRTN